MLLLHRTAETAYTRLLPLKADLVDRTIFLALLFFPGVCGLLGAVWRRRANASGGFGTPTAGSEAVPAEPPQPERPASQVEAQALVRMGRLADAVALLRAALRSHAVELEVALVAAAISAFLSFDGSRAIEWRICRLANQGKWPQVLEEARGLPYNRYSLETLHIVTRALYETGYLPHEMFSYPQHRGGYMLAWGLSSRQVRVFLKRLGASDGSKTDNKELSSREWYDQRLSRFAVFGDLQVQLGLVNDDERDSHEALEQLGEQPVILDRLARINIIKGQTETARMFLRVLSTYLGHGKQARDLLARLEADPLCSDDPEIRRIRSVMVRNESAIFNPYLEDRFDLLLRTNRHNKMAFEYKIAFCLLNHLLDDFVRELDRLDDFGYADIPRHYEEAILVYEKVSNRKVDLRGREISVATRRAFEQFCRAMDVFSRLGDKRRAKEALRADFSGTYFYYYFLGEPQL
jgi:hypothetical protein